MHFRSNHQMSNSSAADESLDNSFVSAFNTLPPYPPDPSLRNGQTTHHGNHSSFPLPSAPNQPAQSILIREPPRPANVKPPKNFEIGEDIESWFDTFKFYCINSHNDRIESMPSTLKYHLSATARALLEGSTSIDSVDNYPDLLEILVSVFRTSRYTESELKSKFFARKQFSDESNASYVSDLIKLFNLAYPIPERPGAESSLIKQIGMGVHDESIRVRMCDFLSSNTRTRSETISELHRLAKQYPSAGRYHAIYDTVSKCHTNVVKPDQSG